MRAALPPRVGQSIGQYQTALRVGVDHLDTLAGHRGHNIAGALGPAARHVLDARDERRYGDRRPSCPMARMAPNMAAPPAMSYFIFSMPSAGLMEMPPVSKVTPLP